jgi:hypothetical protein
MKQWRTLRFVSSSFAGFQGQKEWNNLRTWLEKIKTERNEDGKTKQQKRLNNMT